MFITNCISITIIYLQNIILCVKNDSRKKYSENKIITYKIII